MREGATAKAPEWADRVGTRGQEWVSGRAFWGTVFQPGGKKGEKGDAQAQSLKKKRLECGAPGGDQGAQSGGLSVTMDEG